MAATVGWSCVREGCGGAVTCEHMRVANVCCGSVPVGCKAVKPYKTTSTSVCVGVWPVAVAACRLCGLYV